MFDFPISIGLSPNTQNEDYWQALKIILKPWLWKKGDFLDRVNKWLQDYFKTEHLYIFNCGRSALLALLSAFEIGEGDEVIIQSFTCVAVPDPIIWNNAKPVYADIDDTLNIDILAIEKLITPKTKAIIVQHTFGIPAKIEMIKKITQKHKLILIEDCAHSLGATVNNKLLGKFGDAAFFSFGRDKVISSVFGGAAVINTNDSKIIQKIKNYHQSLTFPSLFWIFQQLLHPLLFAVSLPVYNIGLGKIVIFLAVKFKFIIKPVDIKEMRGVKPDFIPKKFPNALAALLLVQLFKLDTYNLKRRQIAQYYFKNLNGKHLKLPLKIDGAIYLRFNILCNKSETLLINAKKQNLILGNWYKNIIDPKGVSYTEIFYHPDTTPNAVRAAGLSLNLPTLPRLQTKNLQQICNFINNQLSL